MFIFFLYFAPRFSLQFSILANHTFFTVMIFQQLEDYVRFLGVAGLMSRVLKSKLFELFCIPIS